MVQICNQSGKPEAYLVKNIIVNLTNFDAIGVVLGNCVFNKQGTFVGMMRRHYMYNQDGEIVGTKLLDDREYDLMSSQIVNDGWRIVEQIKSHSCTVIEEKQQWANMSFKEVLA